MALGLQKSFKFGLAAIATMVCASLAFGGTIGVSVIDVNSGLNSPGTTEANNGPGSHMDQILTDPGFLWAPAGQNADGSAYNWVSFADTGTNSCPPLSTTCVNNGSTIQFTKTFNLPDAFNTGSITIFADDTAAIFLDGTQLYAENTTLSANCAVGPGALYSGSSTPGPGCRPGTEAIIDIGALTSGTPGAQAGSVNEILGAGTHTLTIDVTQLGGGPFGVMYYGEIMSGTVPEPATYGLLGLGLTGLLAFSRRRKRA